MTTLAAPAYSEWTGCTPTNLGARYTLGNISTAELVIEHLVPTHQVTVSVELSTTTNALVVIGEDVHHARANVRHRFSSTVQGVPSTDIRITGTPTATIYAVTVESDHIVDEYPRPSDVLSVQAFFPLIGINAARFDSSRWNRDAYTTGALPRGAGVFNSSKWDGSNYFHPAVTTGWQDISPNITALSVTRGVNSTGAVHTAQVGTLTIHAVDDLDPRALGLHHGTPVKLLHWPSRTPIFTGVITDQEMTLEPPGSRHSFTTTITVSDAVARISSITRYGARSSSADGSEAWTDRVRRLMASVPEIPFIVGSPTSTRMCATVWETSLANHLDALAASVSGSWHVTRSGEVYITAARVPHDPEFYLTDLGATNPHLDVWSFTAIDLSWKASEVISSVTTTNHAMTQDGSHNAVDTTHTETLPGASAAWAGCAISADTTLVSGIATATRALLRAGTDTPFPREVTLSPAHRKGPTDRAALMAAAARFDPLQSLRVISNGDIFPALTTTITHAITPTTWHVDLTLAPNV